MDPHSVLGVPKNCSPEQVKAAFRNLAKKFHPDRCQDHGAEEKFKRICEAYNSLLPELEPSPGVRSAVRPRHPAVQSWKHSQSGWFDRLARRRSAAIAMVGGVVLVGCCIQYGGYRYYLHNREVLLQSEKSGASTLGNRPSNLRGRFLMALVERHPPAAAEQQLPHSSPGALPPSRS